MIPFLFSPSFNFSPLNIILFHNFLHLLFSKTCTCPQSTYTIILLLRFLSTFYPAHPSSIQHPVCLPVSFLFMSFFYRKKIHPYIDTEIAKVRNLFTCSGNFYFFFFACEEVFCGVFLRAVCPFLKLIYLKLILTLKNINFEIYSF